MKNKFAISIKFSGALILNEFSKGVPAEGYLLPIKWALVAVIVSYLIVSGVIDLIAYISTAARK